MFGISYVINKTLLVAH